ncbi:hypothetical protein [Paenibacillus sp. MER 99-2]|uniref:hypothetical protein n=1 Tax=Paenibacillus sp. MER 99-2 TaxID=2939572 RepID=UPI00203DD37D|nr:hypothetical protein [Paenibacillus sp. MER 99-2]MCM3171904.1 hypothetical protein [Paenibacillus sp. MER 99-2]
MRKLRWEFVMAIIGFWFVLFMTWNEYSKVLTFSVVLTGIFIAFIRIHWYPLAFDKNIERVESYLRNQKNTPGMYINYVMANKLDDEAEVVMEQVRLKYKREVAQAPFKAAYGFYNQDMNAIREAIPHIRWSDYRTYYETYLLLEEGNSEQARERLKSIKKHWMRSALLGAIELKAGRRDLAIQLAKEALDVSKGVHHYVLYKEYERLYPEVVKTVS